MVWNVLDIRMYGWDSLSPFGVAVGFAPGHTRFARFGDAAAFSERASRLEDGLTATNNRRSSTPLSTTTTTPNMLRIAAFLSTLGAAAASAGQGCYDTGTHTCAKGAANCAPYTCNVQGATKVWVSAASASPCSADTSCEDSTMASGVAAGNAITAAAKAFSDAAASCGGTATDTTATPDCAAAFAAASDTLAASCPAGCTYTSKIAAKTAAYTTGASWPLLSCMVPAVRCSCAV